jgi:hypothetical protein
MASHRMPSVAASGLSVVGARVRLGELYLCVCVCVCVCVCESMCVHLFANACVCMCVWM